MAMFTDIVSVVRESSGMTKPEIREVCRSRSDVFWGMVFDGLFDRLKKEGKIVGRGTRYYVPEAAPEKDTKKKTKSLRAKYKAAPKRDMVLIGEWNAPESGPGTFYAPRNRRSQVERTFLAIEEGDESKEAFYSVINAGGVFIRD